MRLARAAVSAGLILLAATTLLSPQRGRAADASFAYSLELNGEISPATAAWVDHALGEAVDEGATVAIIRLDTPGGLIDSLRDIDKDVLAAPLPVIVYTSPDGARAASAGAYLTQAGDVAAMAPDTNIGSSTPISIGPGSSDDVLGRKIKNDAAAYMRALASVHGRNPDPGERMVTVALNLTAQEALDAGFIDVVAPSEEALLAKLDGFRVMGPKAQTLHTAGLRIESHDLPLRYQLLGVLVDPTIAFLLILVGVIGIAVELFSPGVILPGSLGVISFILGLYGSAQLPVTAAGIVLLIVAIALLIAEGQLPTHGILGAAGVVALIFSGLLLFNGDEGAHTSAPVVIAAGLVLGGLLALMIQRAMRARRNPVRAGHEELLGAVATVRSTLDPEGQIFLRGALWRARLATDAEPRRPGDRVRVEAVEGLTLIVAPADREQIDQGADPWP